MPDPATVLPSVDPDSLGTRTSLEALSEIAATVNSVREPGRLLETVLEIAMQTLDAERGFVFLEDDQAEAGFSVRAQRNFAEEELEGLTQGSASVVRAVLQTGEPVLLYEAAADERFGSSQSVVLQKIQSIACVPLRIKARQIGAIYLDSVTQRGRFTREAVPFLRSFAHQAAVAIENAELYQSLRNENRHLRKEVQRAHGFDGIIGQSARMREVFETVTRVLDTDATVLLGGESGTGKELIARAIHYNGHRAKQPFVAIFCGSLPDELLESELFGHKKGAFTGAVADKKGLFEVADGGTIFLDEVGDLSPKLQTSLLRVLQEGEIKRVGDTAVRRVDVRVISATNKDLREEIAGRHFREDLYYRLNTIAIELPPLRQRRDDIPLLAAHFLDRFATGSRAHLRGFTPEALDTLKRYRWPGNVRELENTVERAAVMARGELIAPADLRLPEGEAGPSFDPELPLKEVERRHVEQALAHHEGNVSATARALGVSRRWLHYRLKEWEDGEG
ncbi:MAG: sigma-54-dependent Fis family transcriptional regulator [Rubricoccaceae bacterium]|nr:sigma-54-dependent Fis family transcriptional regulator [Rubricoccaceae bacterium]